MRSLRSFKMLLAFGLFALAAAGIQARDEAEKATTLKVTLPKVRRPEKRPVIMIDGKEVEATKGAKGAPRTVVAPPLKPGKTEYEVTAVWDTNNYTRFFRTKKVAPKPGGVVEVDLSAEDPKVKDHIEIRFVPTPDDVVERMCKLGSVTKDDVVFDLGCGDGRIVCTAVKDFHAKKGVGVDLDPERIKESKERAKKMDLEDKVTFRVQDVLKIDDLSTASVVMLYMGDDVNVRLKPILQKTLKPGSRIVSHRFLMGDWKPEKTVKFEAADGEEYEIHLWTIPAKK